MDERARRIGRNEALYRAVNEQVHGLNNSFASLADPMSAVCECGSADCDDRIELSAAAYEAVRQDPTRFVIKPGHEEPDVEAVVERRETYLVVQKREGGAAELAREADPRS
jgi:hypothetical protein